jgi:hypothetical protein
MLTKKLPCFGFRLPLVLFTLVAVFGSISGCSSYNPPRQQSHRTTAPLPEITRPAVRPQVHAPTKRVITSSVVQKPRPHPPGRQLPVKKPKPTVTVQRNSDKPKQTVITQTEVQAVLTPDEIENAQPQPVQSEPDPYENIPESSDQQSADASSPAVKSLMIRARADLALGSDQSAISKLERALRIEPSNAGAWYLLARAHQSLGEHQQAITMAKKAINFAGADEAMALKSWQLIKQSGEASGDSIAVQEAINYSKVNP